MSQSKVIKFCVFCKGREVKTTTKKLYCMGCRRRSPVGFSTSRDATPEDIEQLFGQSMIYCYNCGEELIRDEGRIVCIDGCELIDIEFRVTNKKVCIMTVNLTP